MQLDKEWKRFIVYLWKNYKDNPICMRDFEVLDKYTLYELWRWGCLKRIDRGVYQFTRKGRSVVQALYRGEL